jgi:hypothetical protein
VGDGCDCESPLLELQLFAKVWTLEAWRYEDCGSFKIITFFCLACILDVSHDIGVANTNINSNIIGVRTQTTDCWVGLLASQTTPLIAHDRG